MAVTRDGIPVRVWSWPGNTADSGLIRQVKKDLREWVLSKVIWVADRGFTSSQNRRVLMQGGGGYIIGEKLRSGSAEVKTVMSRQGRYKTVRDNLQVKEVRPGDDSDRFIICYNPGQAERDAAIRAKLIAQLEELISGTDQLTAAERAKLEGALAAKPGLKRFLRVTPAGLLRIDKAKAKAEENLDGKYLLRCSDPDLSAEDIALGYKQLLEVERGWRDMKQVIDLRPVYHRREDRIRAHVILCWLALLLIRVTENTAGRPWNRIRAELQRQHAVTWTGPAGTFRQSTDLTKPQRDIYTALSIEPPKKIISLAPAPPEAARAGQSSGGGLAGAQGLAQPLQVGAGGLGPVLDDLAQPRRLHAPEVDHALDRWPAPGGVGLQVKQCHLPDVAGERIGSGVLGTGSFQVPAQVAEQSPGRGVVLHAAALADSLGVGVAQRAGRAQAGEQDPHLAGVQRRRRLVTALQRVEHLSAEHLGQAGQGELVHPEQGRLGGDPCGQLAGRQAGDIVTAAEPDVVEPA